MSWFRFHFHSEYIECQIQKIYIYSLGKIKNHYRWPECTILSMMNLVPCRGRLRIHNPPSSQSRKATASLLQPNQKPTAVLSDTTQEREPSTLSGSSETAAHDGAVSCNESTVLDNYPNYLTKQIQPIIHQFEKKKRSKSADPSFRSSKVSISELRMDAALGNKQSSLRLDKSERREKIIIFFKVYFLYRILSLMKKLKTTNSTIYWDK